MFGQAEKAARSHSGGLAQGSPILWRGHTPRRSISKPNYNVNIFACDQRYGQKGDRPWVQRSRCERKASRRGDYAGLKVQALKVGLAWRAGLIASIAAMCHW